VNEPESVANHPQTSSFIPTIRNYSSAPDEVSHAFQPFTAVFRNFGKKTVHEFGEQRGAHSDVDYLLTVREVARCLNVSTATVYALCGRGELAHVRISNAIRIVPAELRSFLLRNQRRP
jgi:excisionase family DNA binding protein